MSSIASPEKTLEVITDCMKSIRHPLTDIQLESRLVGDLGYESIDVVDLIFEIQQRFNIEIEFSEILFFKGQSIKYQDLKTLHLVELVKSKVKN